MQINFCPFATFQFEQPRVLSVLPFKLILDINKYLLLRISVSANVDIIAFLKDPDVTPSVWVQSMQLAFSQAG
jgi:hypothetical protein